MTKIVQLKKEGINEYPVTMPEAVIDSDGITVKDKIKTLENKIEGVVIKGSLATINGQSIENGGNIKIQANAEIFTPESAGSTNRETTTESRVYRAFYNIQNDEFTINNGSEKKSVPLWHINKLTALGEIVNINIEDEHSTLQSCTAKVTLLPTVNIQFDYLDTHYTLTWIADNQHWDVTKTPINTGADWNAQEGEDGYIKNRTHRIYTYGVADPEYHDDGHCVVTTSYPSKQTKEAPKFVLYFRDNKWYNNAESVDAYGCKDRSNILELKVGNSIIKRFNNTDNGDNDPYFLQISVEDVYVDVYDQDSDYENTVYRYTLFVENAGDYGINVNEVIPYIEYGNVVTLNDIYIPNTIARKSELTELSAEIGKKQNTITDLETIRSGAAKGATALQSVPDTYATKTYVDDAIKDIPAPTPSASNEWKCVADRRLLEGEKKFIFTTYADGTPLKAKEVMVQILCDKKAAQNITGYVGIKSTNNQNETLYGSLTYEMIPVDESNQRLQQMRICASPFFTIAEFAPDVKCTIASPTNGYYQGGNLKTFQIYEDIVYVKIDANVVLTSAAPYLKVYAR